MPDLKSLPDNTLVQYIKLQDDLAGESILELKTRHGGIVNQTFNRYSGVLSDSGVFPRDLYTSIDKLIMDTALSYRDNKNKKYSTWLCDQARYFCLNSLHAEQKHTKGKELDYLIEGVGIKEEEIDEEDQGIIEKVRQYIETVEDERVKVIFKMRYFDAKENGKKYLWKEISEIIDVSTQYIHYLHNLHLEKIRKLLV